MMMILQADRRDLDWVHTQYRNIGIAPSSSRDLVYIARLDGRNAAVGRITRIDQETAELEGIHILEEFQGEGLALPLVQEMLHSAVSRSIRQLYCLTYPELTGFYRRFGFIPSEKGLKHPYFARKLKRVRGNAVLLRCDRRSFAESSSTYTTG